jgi:lysyl-tRNA synthetase, class II
MIAEEIERRSRLKQLRDAGHDPYPARVERTHTLEEVHQHFADLEMSQEPVSVVGRIRAIRRHGKLAFLRIEDGHATSQLLVKFDTLGNETYDLLMDNADVGDFIEGTGPVLTTKSGEESIAPEKIRIISKAILPLPEKWHGLSDVEMRFRQRELDLISNESVRAVFKARAIIISTIRRFFDGNNFLEVDTPVLQHVAAGASARPFETHHNALDEKMFLRIAPELFLKRCVIGGFERVYEIARCYRNEGIDHSHNPEFSQVEAYAAYMDYEELMNLMENLILEMIAALGKDPEKISFSGNTLTFTAPFRRITFRDLIFEIAKIDVDLIKTRDDAVSVAKENGIEIDDSDSLTTVLDLIWKKTVRPKVIQPTFVTDYPAAMTPLAKRKEDNPERIEMFQLVLGGGFEVMKAFTELNDPIDQEDRMQEQEEAHKEGDDEAQRRDDDFLRAMKHGMPPMAGVGMGIERITQVLTDSHNIKEVILFPTLKSETNIEEYE